MLKNLSSLILTTFLIVFFSVNGHAQVPSQGKYIDKEKPALNPQLFAPGIVSKPNRSEFGSVFTRDGEEFYFAVDGPNSAEIMYMKLENGEWTKPISVISHERYSYNDPFLTPDEQELYYISNMPKSPGEPMGDYDIWYSRKTDNAWSDPINAGPAINSEKNEYYISFTSDGKMYFSTNKHADPSNENNFDIYSSVRENGEYQSSVSAGISINTSRYEADVYVAPDESYIIFCGRLEEGLGRGDLYISFKENGQNWSKPKNMGSKINTKGHELCPFVTLDGKYFFYTSNQDIYWVSTEIFEELK